MVNDCRMKGPYRLQVFSSSLKYDLILDSKYTIITGDSATGKTELVRMVLNDNTNRIISDVPVTVLITLRDIQRLVSIEENRIYIIDEDVVDRIEHDFISVRDLLEKSKGYFIICARECIRGLQFAIDDIFELRTHQFVSDRDYFGNSLSEDDYEDRVLTMNSIVKYYNEVYGWCENPDFLITEDLKSGREFYRSYFKNAEILPNDKYKEGFMRGGGKGTIYSKMEYVYSNFDEIDLVVIVDNIAFGHFIYGIESFLRESKRVYNREITCYFFAPKCFEYLIARTIEGDTDRIIHDYNYYGDEKYMEDYYFKVAHDACRKGLKGTVKVNNGHRYIQKVNYIKGGEFDTGLLEILDKAMDNLRTNFGTLSEEL